MKFLIMLLISTLKLFDDASFHISLHVHFLNFTCSKQSNSIEQNSTK